MMLMRPHPIHRERGGFIFGMVILMVVIVAIAILAWIVFLPRVVISSVREATGLSCEIERLYANPLTGDFKAEGVRIGNPAGWGDEPLAEISRLEGKLNVLSLRSATAVVENAEVDLTRLVVIVDERGRTNFQSLALRIDERLAGDMPVGLAVTSAGLAVSGQQPTGIVVQRLDLHLMRLEMLDRGVTPSRRVGDDLDYRGTYRNVRKPAQLLSPTLTARLVASPVLFNMIMSSGLLNQAAIQKSGLDHLWGHAAGALNSLLRGLEQKPKP